MTNGYLTDEELEREVRRMRRRPRPSPHLLWIVPLLFLGYVGVRFVHRGPSLDERALAVADGFVRDAYVRRHDADGLRLVAGSRSIVRGCGLRQLVAEPPSTPAEDCVAYTLVAHSRDGGYTWRTLDLVLGRRNGRWVVLGSGSPTLHRCAERQAWCRKLWARRLEPTVPA